jgi:hypothetical protein
MFFYVFRSFVKFKSIYAVVSSEVITMNPIRIFESQENTENFPPRNEITVL